MSGTIKWGCPKCGRWVDTNEGCDAILCYCGPGGDTRTIMMREESLMLKVRREYEVALSTLEECEEDLDCKRAEPADTCMIQEAEEECVQARETEETARRIYRAALRDKRRRAWE